MIGAAFSHYKIVEKLGEGAMGVVYKAEDTKLDRFVALKFFPADLTANIKQKERFIREAKAASALDHTNICTIHEIGKTEDGRTFICMPFYNGETLMEKIGRGPLRLEEAIDYSIQVARGMEKVHEKGIVHRDIKPQNLIVTVDNVVKIVDFGLAKLAGAKRLTLQGITVGTLGYMSPEQARGGEVTRQADIWSSGVVLYEMITGRLPFNGDNPQAVIYSILNEEPEPVTGLRPNVPLELERIINKCLSKECANRYRSFDELIADLSLLNKKPGSAADANEKPVVKKAPVKFSPRIIFPVILAAMIISVFVYLFFVKNKGAEISIAVLPFEDMSPDGQQEYFCDGMVEELITALSRVEGLNVTSRTSTFQFKGKKLDIREIGERLNVKNVLEGSVRRAGKRVRITAQLIDAADGYHLWSDAFEREFEFDDVFKIQDEITKKIVKSLEIKLSVKGERPLIKRYTKNAEAYELYLKGRYFWEKRLPEDMRKGIDFFIKAIEKDPDYALAHVGLANSYFFLANYSILPPKDVMPVAKAAVLKALEIDDTLAEAHNWLAIVKLYEWDWQAAEREFKRAIELSPALIVAHEWYAKCLAVTNRVEESLAAIKRTAKIAPFSISTQIAIGRHLYYARKYDAASRQFKKVLKLEQDNHLALTHLGQAYVKMSMFREAIDCFEKAKTITKGKDTACLSGLGYAFGMSGKKEDALKTLEELNNLASQRYVDPAYIAAIYIGIGDKDNAFQSLEEAYICRSNWMKYLLVEHMFEPLHDDPRFVALVKKVGLKR